MEKRKIIMDVDTGSDDAVALVMAMLDEQFDLLGITTVNGNLEVKLTTDNSLRVVECCEKQGSVKVYQGCEYPIASTLMPGSEQAQLLPRREGTRTGPGEIHFDHLPLPEPTIQKADESAVVWLIQTLLAHPDGEITLVPVGPLTNIAVALRADPRIIPKIKEIVIMGGGHAIGNITPATEYNIWCDPEALEIVTQAGCKMTMVPLDATHAASITLKESERIRAIGTKPAILVADMIAQRVAGYAYDDTEMQEDRGVLLHDALAVCSVIHPEVLKDVRHVSMHTDISHGFAYGRTIIDLREYSSAEPNTYFALGADKPFFYQWIIDVLEKAKEAL